ncbi:hypothetical protein [Cedecea davisae]|uniref:hypothetical protein n=1 Tax=Cedecea davisae TaxID=158484 RepID=UPI001D0B4ECF|nr:hypothetical protein [Cedecea davisae]
MSNKIFGGYKEPKKGKEKELNLPHLVIAIESQNAKNAAVLIEAEFIKKYPDEADHYFAVKVFEDRPGLPRGTLNEFTSEFFTWGVRWNKELKDMEPVNEPTKGQDKTAEPQYIETSKLAINVRSALLALFGRLDKITKAEYGLAIDLTNDTEPSFARELGEALSHTPRVHALYEEKVTELLTAVKEKVPEFSQWTAIKKFIDTWLDAPADKREQPARQGPFYFKRQATGECGDVFTLDGLNKLCNDGCIEITKVEYLQWRDEMALVAAQKEKQGAENASNQQTGTAAILDGKGPEDSDLASDPADTDPAASEVKPVRTVFSVEELINAPAAAPRDTREELSPRQFEICQMINDLVSGHTNIMAKEEAEGVIACAGLPVSDIFPLLIVDIETTECLVHPNFSEREVHDVATSILDNWSNDISERQKVALDDIVEWRKLAIESAKGKAPAKTAAGQQPLRDETVKPAQAPELTFHQQLTLAALRGLCANPAHATSFEELPDMARHLADVLARAEE